MPKERGTVRNNVPADFWSRVRIGKPEECWEWAGGKDDAGYGALRYQGRRTKAHRLAWELTHGTLPPEVIVRHKVCDNPPCCNPSHLLTGSNKDNSNDRDEKGRTAHNFGVKCGKSKLTEGEVVSIRRVYAQGGTSHRKLAKQFGVSKGTITFILHGDTWRHVDAQR